jgi:hypothetical protein
MKKQFAEVHPYLIMRNNGDPTGIRFSNIKCAARTVIAAGSDVGLFVKLSTNGQIWEWYDCIKIAPPNEYLWSDMLASISSGMSSRPLYQPQ